MRENIEIQLHNILLAYAQIIFIDRAWAGVVCLLATFWYPNIGIAGMLSVLVSIFASHILRMPNEESGLHVLNALLVGLSLGAFYQLDLQLFIIIVISSLLTLFLTTILTDLFWRLGRVPVMSVSFVLVAFTVAFATKSYAELTPFLQLKLENPLITYPWLDTFFSSLGAIFFNPHPLVGMLIFFAILIRSRYLAMLCIAGYAVGLSFFTYLAGEHIVDTIQWNGFNFSLTAMALGGFYIIPSVGSFIVALLGAGIAALLTTTLQNFLFIFGLPVMATPFLASTLIILFALSRRRQMASPQLVLEEPAQPEDNYERARITRVRLGEYDSVPIRAPFYGEWQVYQGFDDRHTHIAPWQYALDFFKMQESKSYAGTGAVLENYFCYGLPVVSPVYGTVIRTQQEMPDNIPGEVDVKNNWGNFVLIRMANGLHLLMAHLKQHSVRVSEGEDIIPGDAIGQCGNSGRSPQPHLHVQVQTTAILGAPTYPFHLTSMVVNHTNEKPEFKLFTRPVTGQYVKATTADEQLKEMLHMPVGRVFNYEFVDRQHEAKTRRQLHVELSLLGHFKLRSDRGAEVKIIETEDLIAFFDRRGKRDRFLDMWLLAFGVTPFAEEARIWNDSLSSKIMPLKKRQQLVISLLYPLGKGIKSEYHRHYDNETKCWQQNATHVLDTGIAKYRADTQVEIDVNSRKIFIKMQYGARRWEASLLDVGQVEDVGIPSWPIKNTQS